MLKLIEQYSDFGVYEHHTKKAVLIVNTKSGNNGAIFDNVAQAQAKALSLLWGGNITLTHRFKKPNN